MPIRGYKKPIDHTDSEDILNVGTNTHAQIDNHLAGALSVHAATTSAQLAEVITDETGSGSLVFANSPTLTTPNIGAATATSITIGGNTLDASEWANLDGINQTLATTSSPQFANLIITAGGNIKPSSNSTSAINIAQADGTSFVTFDTTNKRVGIGTTAPSGKLHVEGTGNVIFNQSGNVGIGTTEPGSYKLAVEGDIGITAGKQISFAKNLGAGNLYYGIRLSENNVQLYTYNASGRTIQLGVADGSTTFTPYVIMTGTGNVGIRTTSPSYTLDISGSQRILSGTLAIGTNPDSRYPVYVRKDVTGATSAQNIIGIYTVPRIEISANVTDNSIGLDADIRKIVNTGVTDSGYAIGILTSVLRNSWLSTSDDNGTLTNLRGIHVYYGHYNTNTGATPQTTNAYGIYIIPYYKSGTITNMYDIYLASPSTGGTVTNRWGIYQANTANNYFAGSVGIGTANPETKLDVAGVIKTNSAFLAGATNGTSRYDIKASSDSGTIIMLSQGSSATGSHSGVGRGMKIITPSDSVYPLVISQGGNQPIILGTSDTERMRITGDGKIGIGRTSLNYTLDVNGTFGFTPGSSVTPVNNGDVVIELTNNTTLTFKAKGSDGTVRSATLTLA